MNKLAIIGLACGLAHASPVIEETRKLTVPNSEPSDRFSQSVATHGNIAAVAAPQDRWDPADPTDPPRSVRGTVHLFDHRTGEYLARLTSPEAPIGFQPFGFGYSIDLDAQFLVVGSPDSSELGERSGSVHVFDAVTHEHLHTLLDPDGAANEFFGRAVAVSQGIVAVGAPGHNTNGTNAGAVYLFDAATGSQIGKLLPDQVSSTDAFGSAVSIHENLVVVGAPNTSTGGSHHHGAVYFFELGSTQPIAVRTGSTGSEYGSAVDVSHGISIVAEEPYQTLPFVRLVLPDRVLRRLSSNGLQRDCQYGESVAIDQGHALVAATARTDVDPQIGEIQVFEAQSGRWITALRASDLGTPQFSFNAPVAVHEGTALVGSPYDNAAYVYDLPDLCPADFAEPYTQLDFFDVTDFLERFAGEDAWADLAAPTGVFDASDFAAFLNAYTNGCP